jgi:hypothetical protein
MTLGILLLACVVVGGTPAAASPGQAPAAAVEDGPQTPSAPKKTGPPSTSDSGFAADMSIDFTRNGPAVWWQLTPSASFVVNDHWSLEAGLPIYLINSALSTDRASHVGLGDLYGSLTLDLSGDETTFYTTMSVSAPTGSVAQGLGYGQITWDWTNHAERSVGPLTPYVDAGFGNALDLTSRVNRARAGGVLGPPPAQVGSVFNGEGGIELDWSESVSLSVSAYVIAPWGQQIAVTRIGRQRTRVILHALTASERDQGVSTTLSASVTPALDLSVWFWHSGTFHNNTVSVSAVVHVSDWLKRPSP